VLIQLPVFPDFTQSLTGEQSSGQLQEFSFLPQEPSPQEMHTNCVGSFTAQLPSFASVATAAGLSPSQQKSFCFVQLPFLSEMQVDFANVTLPDSNANPMEIAQSDSTPRRRSLLIH